MQTKIKLRIKYGKRIIANELDASNDELDQSDGSVEGDGQDTIEWWNDTGHSVEVRFYRPGNPNPQWPFTGSGTSLNLSDGKKETKTLRDNNSTKFARWKYEVKAPPGSNVDPLDPMIIIRGKSSTAKLALVAGVSLVTGLVIGPLWNSMN